MNSKSTRRLGLALIIGIACVNAGAEGYVKSSSGEVVRNSFGECWHTPYWTPGDAIVGCDGKVAATPVAVVETTVVAVPVMPVPAATTLERAVYFGFDRSELQGTAIDEIDRILTEIPATAKISEIRVEGYTDPIGTEEYNQALSERRAQAVERYLIERRGLSQTVISTRGRGESDIKVTCEGRKGAALIDCLQPNRRADVEVNLQ